MFLCLLRALARLRSQRLGARVREETGLPEGIDLHGLRHSLASHMAIQGAEAAEIMTALGHSQLSTAQKYVH
jgi:site-specific recombinase XerD